jgi:hypothetical protein
MKGKKKNSKKEKKVDFLKDFKKLNPKPVEVKKKG